MAAVMLQPSPFLFILLHLALLSLVTGSTATAHTSVRGSRLRHRYDHLSHDPGTMLRKQTRTLVAFSDDHHFTKEHIHEGLGNTENIHEGLGNTQHVHEGLGNTKHVHEGLGNTKHVHEGLGNTEGIHKQTLTLSAGEKNHRTSGFAQGENSNSFAQQQQQQQLQHQQQQTQTMRFTLEDDTSLSVQEKPRLMGHSLGIETRGNNRPREMSERSAPPSPSPSFLPPPATQITTRAGQSAALTCIVKNLGNRQVSWIRGRDLHVLSSGDITFSSDARINATGSGEAWTFTLRYTQLDDGGRYGCQVNTQPPLLTWYNLTVVEARASIEGSGGTRYVQAGSTVTLHCVVREQLMIPGLVLWYQGDGLVARDGQRVKIETTVANLSDAAADTELGSLEAGQERSAAAASQEGSSSSSSSSSSNQGVTTSTLTVANAAPRDSGNYSCWPSAGRPDSVLLHVIQAGERPAAMQHGNSSTRPSTSLHLLLHSLHLLLHLLLHLRLS